MPVIFSTPTSHQVLMLDKDATKILEAMKTSGNIPSALYPEAIPGALAALQDRIQIENTSDNDNLQAEDQSNHVSMQRKALPLIELLERAIEKNEKLMWDEG